MNANWANNSNGNQGSNWIYRPTRLRIYDRDGHLCLWCGRKVKPGADGNATLDHFIPRPEGSNLADNVFTACRTCNSERGGRTAHDYALAVAVRVSGRPGRHGHLQKAIIARIQRALRRRI